MKTIFKIILGVIILSLVTLFITPSFTVFFSGWHGFDAILVKIAELGAVALFLGYYIALLWEKHKP